MCSQIIRYIVIIFFMVSLWTPLIIAMTTPAKDVSLTEKRKLAPLPALGWDSWSNFPQAFEAYYNDHFGLREQLLQGYNYYQFSLLNISSSNRVIVGKNGWLFQNGGDHVKDMRNIWPFSPAELQHWARPWVKRNTQQDRVSGRILWLRQRRTGQVRGTELPLMPRLLPGFLPSIQRV